MFCRLDIGHLEKEAEIVFGGDYDDAKGFFIEPTLAVINNPRFCTMEEKSFGPLLTVYVHDDTYEETLRLCDETSRCGLTAAVSVLGSLDSRGDQKKAEPTVFHIEMIRMIPYN